MRPNGSEAINLHVFAIEKKSFLRPEHEALLAGVTANRGIAPKTLKGYVTGWQQFSVWLAERYPDDRPLELGENTPAAVAVFLADLLTGTEIGGRKVGPMKAGSLEIRLRGINFHLREEGIPAVTAAGHPQIHRLLDHARRETAKAGGERQARGMTEDLCGRVAAMLEHRAICGRIDRTSKRGNVAYTDWPHEPGPACEGHQPPARRRKALYRLAYIRVGFGGGLRISEVMRAKWGDVKPHETREGAGRLHIRRSKADVYGKGVYQALPPSAMKALARLRAELPPEATGDDQYIFPSRSGNTYRTWIRNAARDAGIVGWRAFSTHSLRIGAAMTLAAKGASEYQIQRTFRWANARMVSRYCRQAESPADAALDFLS